MAILNYRLSVPQALQIVEDIDLGKGLKGSHSVIPAGLQTENSIDTVIGAANVNRSDIYIISLVTDESNQIMAPYVADISEAFQLIRIVEPNLYFRYVAL